MPSLQCQECGLMNWSTQEQCKRCHTPLSTAPHPGALDFQGASLKNPRNKWLVAVALIGLLIGTVGVVAYTFSGKAAALNLAFEAAIRISPEFNVPVRIDVGRYTFLNPEAQRYDQGATPAAYTLDHLGLLSVANRVYSDTPMNQDSRGRELVDPETGRSFQQYRHIELALTERGQSQAADWESYDNQKEMKEGWKVPIGERQLVRVMQVMPLPENQPLDHKAQVSFTWQWKPNEIGQSFDRRSSSYQVPRKAQGYLRNQLDVEVNDSQITYWGIAYLFRVNGVWEASRITWYGPDGIIMSPNMSDEIEKQIRLSQPK